MRHLAAILLTAFALTTATQSALAAEPVRFMAQISQGMSLIDNRNFENDFSGDVQLGLDLGLFEIHAGVVIHEPFKFERRPNSEIEIDSTVLSAAKAFRIADHTDAALYLGLNRWKAEATLNGKHVGNDNGNDAWLRASVRAKLTRKLALTGNLDHFMDVSGTDIQRVSVGVLYAF